MFDQRWVLCAAMSTSRLPVLVATCLLGALVAVPSAVAGAAPWSWRASGSLGKVISCSGTGARGAGNTCSFTLTDPPSGPGIVEELVSLRNTSTQRVCYGISLSTSHMAGLQSFCVKPRSTGQYRQHGAAGDYRGGRISIFVTSGSRAQPIGAVKSSSKSPFTVVFSEGLPVATLDFKVYAPTYFAGFHFTKFALTDGSACTDRSRSAFVLGGRGTFGNDYPGADIFEKAANTCGSGTGFNTKIAYVVVNGHDAEVWSNCAGVSSGACGAVQVRANGGLITWTVPAVDGYRPTTISVTTYNLAYSVLLAVARGIK